MCGMMLHEIKINPRMFPFENNKKNPHKNACYLQNWEIKCSDFVKVLLKGIVSYSFSSPLLKLKEILD